MLDIGFQELIVLMVIALLVFGPYKLPELGRSLGRAIREFRRASDEFRSTIETNLNINDDSPIFSASVDTPTAAAESPITAPGAGSGLDPQAIPPPSDPVPFAGPALDGPGHGGEAAGSASGGVRPELVEPFCTQRAGRLVHRSTCAWAGRIPDSDRVVLKTAAEGTELGLVRCPVCDPYDADATS